MIDVDQVLWAPYEGILGRPIMLCEVKPESPREDFWGVTRSLAQLAAIPAAKIIERQDGTYDVFLAQESNGYEPHLLGHGMTIHDWYDFVESRFRRST